MRLLNSSPPAPATASSASATHPEPPPPPPPLDVLVIGSGIAGCTAALRAAERGRRVTLLTKASEDPLRENNSYWAQGGIIYKSSDPDEQTLLAADVKRAGAGQCKHEAVAKLAAEGPGAVEAFLLGPNSAAEVPFDRVEPSSDEVEEEDEDDEDEDEDEAAWRTSNLVLKSLWCEGTNASLLRKRRSRTLPIFATHFGSISGNIAEDIFLQEKSKS